MKRFVTLSAVKETSWLCAVCGEENRDNFCANCGTAKPEEYKVGNTMTFGKYTQGENRELAPVEWEALDVQNGEVLFISKYGLDVKPYNKEAVGVTWETCTLRKWLNADFLNAVFSVEEQQRIVTTTVDNSKAQGYSNWNTNGGNNTQDKIFLLSYAEANKYFGVTWNSTDNRKLRVQPTAYAIRIGALTKPSFKTEAGEAAGLWWLRSPGLSQDTSARVGFGGALRCSIVNYGDVCVRPAFWMKL